MHRRPARTAALIPLVLLALVAGCSSDDTTTTTSAPDGGDLSITVSAAASLTEAFTTIRDDFVDKHPEAEIALNFGSSGALVTQIQQGAPADVAAFADTTPMSTLDDEGLLASPPQVFARNHLVIVTKPGNPDGITGLADLAAAGTISLCVDTAPCGKFADQILTDADVSIPTGSITRGADVKATLTAVSEGDAAAGIVYVTDAAAAGDKVDTVEIPEADDVTALYPIAPLASSSSAELADAFVAYVLSDEGQRVLADAGFGTP